MTKRKGCLDEKTLIFFVLEIISHARTNKKYYIILSTIFADKNLYLTRRKQATL